MSAVIQSLLPIKEKGALVAVHPSPQLATTLARLLQQRHCTLISKSRADLALSKILQACPITRPLTVPHCQEIRC